MSHFPENQYLIRKKILKLLGGAFHIYDASGGLAGYTKMKAFKLKEDLRMYADEAMTREIFSIKARNIIDISATYDVIDSETGAVLGAFRRKGLKSILKDEWLILGQNDQEIGIIQEDSMALALIRRFATNLLPQTYNCSLNGQPACTFKQNFNPFVMKIQVNFEPDVSPDMHTFLMAGGILLCAIEGKQDN